MAQHVVVTETGVPYAQRIETGGFLLSSDEPASAGGADAGPDPYALLLAALGACTSVTLRMYANRKGWPLEAVSVRVGHDKIHARDCDDCETRDDGRIDRFTREITLTGPLSEEQRQRLAEIAERCPVHRTLMGQKTIVTRLVP
jgi:putative redox protein